MSDSHQAGENIYLRGLQFLKAIKDGPGFFLLARSVAKSHFANHADVYERHRHMPVSRDKCWCLSEVLPKKTPYLF